MSLAFPAGTLPLELLAASSGPAGVPLVAAAPDETKPSLMVRACSARIATLENTLAFCAASASIEGGRLPNMSVTMSGSMSTMCSIRHMSLRKRSLFPLHGLDLDLCFCRACSAASSAAPDAEAPDARCPAPEPAARPALSSRSAADSRSSSENSLSVVLITGSELETVSLRTCTFRWCELAVFWEFFVQTVWLIAADSFLSLE
mmetsp:Transcript_56044/g.126466  ORF Transcript_56044/g.126466 Transcript_56044/m.126466 type:complete len:204 (-) Transcript_56044:332-943(-)